jgi:heme exporter protein A
MSIFEGEKLACIRAERLVFARLDFRIEPGGALRLTGANGSGKSSLLRVMAELIRPAAGALTFDGAPVAGDMDAHRARLAFIGHMDALKPAFSVRETLAFWQRFYGAGRDTEAVARGLDVFALTALADFPVRILSSGQRRRLALARLIAAPAPLWLLDEPTTGLDARSVAALERALADHRAGGGMVALATHTAIDLPHAGELELERFRPTADESIAA